MASTENPPVGCRLGSTVPLGPVHCLLCFYLVAQGKVKHYTNIYIYMTIFPVPNFSCLLPIGMALFSSFSIALNYVLLVSCMTSYLWHRRRNCLAELTHQGVVQISHRSVYSNNSPTNSTRQPTIALFLSH